MTPTAYALLIVIGAAAAPPAVAQSVRPFLGLREELRRADAVVVVRVTGVEPADRPSESQRIEATVQKVLAGSFDKQGAQIQLWLEAGEQRRWVRESWDGEFRAGVHPGSDVTALVKRNGERLEILNLLDADESLRTSSLLAEYARLAALDDDGFRLGLARLIADVVRGAPDRLLWVRWTLLALDDWKRLSPPSPAAARRVHRIAATTLDAVVAQLDAFPPPPDEFGPNLHDLPWLIRLLTEPERRRLAKALLRLHPIAQRDLDAASARSKAEARDWSPEDELTLTEIDTMAVAAGMSQLMECLALCLDPRGGRWRPGEATLERAKAFAR